MTDNVSVLGVPMDLGADRRGVDMGPSAIRYAGLAEELQRAGVECRDAGDVTVPRPEERDPDAGEPTRGQAKFLSETADVCRRLSDRVESVIAEGSVPLVLGGDHSIAIGTVGGAAADADLGLVWFDAHGDLNTPMTTPSGNVHGMSLAAILGLGEFEGTDWAHAPGVDPSNVAWVGLRALDEAEREAIRASEATALTISDIDERGIGAVTEEALDVATSGTDGIHVSLDMDFLDPTEAPGVGTPVRGGVSYREAHAAMEAVAARESTLRSFEVVEVNPILDQHNGTAELAVELVSSAFGKRIL